MKKVFKTQAGRFIAGIIAFFLVVAITTGAQHLNFLKRDMTDQQLMTMSSASCEIAAAVEKDVTIYHLATESTKDQWTAELARQYTQKSSHISYKMIDPAGTEAQTLAAQCGASAESNSLIVASENRAVLIASSDIYLSLYNEEILYTYGQYILESQEFAADEELANAILYVTRDDLPVIYALTGHGETSVGSLMTELLREKNIVLESLTLTEQVPENASALLIHGISSDLSDAETEAILTYLKKGGRLILLTDYQMEGLDNLKTVTAYYGMEPTSSVGVVLDAANGYCYSSEYIQYLKPALSNHEITSLLVESDVKATVGLAGAMVRNSIRRTGLNVTTLMTTSEESYMKNMQATSLEKEEDDPSGPFALAMAASEGDTRVAWYASSTIFTDNEIAISNGMNLYVLRGTLDWMVTGVDSIEIENANISSESVSIPENLSAIIYLLLFIPALAMLTIGFIVSRKRNS